MSSPAVVTTDAFSSALRDARTPDLLEVFTLNRLGRRPSPITLPGYRKGQAPASKGLRMEPEPLTHDEVLRLLRQTSRRGVAGFRDRALYVVLWRTGLRISEALDLEVRDLDIERGFLRVRHGKGDRARVVAIDPAAVPVIQEWLELRAKIPNLPKSATVFCTISQPAPGGHLWATNVRDKMKLLGARAGIEKRIHPHGLRHTHALELELEGRPLRVIKEQLGHQHFATTERYLRRIAPGEAIKQLHDRPGFDI